MININANIVFSTYQVPPAFYDIFEMENPKDEFYQMQPGLVESIPWTEDDDS